MLRHQLSVHHVRLSGLSMTVIKHIIIVSLCIGINVSDHAFPDIKQSLVEFCDMVDATKQATSPDSTVCSELHLNSYSCVRDFVFFYFHCMRHIIVNTIQYNTIQYNTIQYNTIQSSFNKSC